MKSLKDILVPFGWLGYLGTGGSFGPPGSFCYLVDNGVIRTFLICWYRIGSPFFVVIPRFFRILSISEREYPWEFRYLIDPEVVLILEWIEMLVRFVLVEFIFYYILFIERTISFNINIIYYPPI